MEKSNYLSLSTQKLKVAHLVNYFPGFFLGGGAKILRIVHPVSYSYLPSLLQTSKLKDLNKKHMTKTNLPKHANVLCSILRPTRVKHVDPLFI